MDIDEIIKKANALSQQNRVIELRALEDLVIQAGDAYFIYRFARNVKGASISKLEDALIRTGNACYIYYFAESVEGADIANLWSGIQTTCDQFWINPFKSNILSKHPEILEEEYPHMLDTDDEPLEFIDLD